jgi:hypothetical protein
MQTSMVMRIVIVLNVVFLLACHPSASEAQVQKTATEPQLLVVLIGGMDSDPTTAQIQKSAKRNEGNSGLYRLLGDLQHKQIEAKYFNWNGTEAGQIRTTPAPGQKAIIKAIRDHVQARPQCKLIIVGNSWGGHTACQVCEQIEQGPVPVSVEYAVFLDPSSTGRAGQGRPEKLPANVKGAANYHTRNLFGWRSWPKEQRIENIDLGDQKHGYLVPKGPAYDAAFSFEAHVAAEWDERIHADIRKRILAYLPEAATSKK